MTRILICFMVLSTAPLLAQTTYTVSLDGSADFTDIQSAIDAAADGDTVLVSPGEYTITEPLHFNPLLEERGQQAKAPAKNLVLRSLEGPNSTVIRMAEEPSDPDLASVVIFESGESEASVLQGFTLTGGSGSYFLCWGDCMGGGGVYCSGSSPTLTNCTISRNSVDVLQGYGGGLYCEAGASPTLIDCTITGNSAESGGGLFGDGSPALVNCMISGNSAEFGGGVVCANFLFGGGSPALINCTITGNLARGLFCGDFSDPTLTNCIVWDNIGESIVQNRSNVTYSCIEAEDAWQGEGNINEDPVFVKKGVFDFERRTEDGFPDFIVDPGDYRLHPDSPCIDAGSSDGASETDLEGNPKPCGAAIDMGAYEFLTEDCIPPSAQFIRGNADAHGDLDIVDAIFSLSYLFLGEAAPPCLDAADTNDDGELDIADPVALLFFSFLGEAQPPSPFSGCGTDDTLDGLSCELFPDCAEQG